MKEYEGRNIQLYAFLSWQWMDTSLGFKARDPDQTRGLGVRASDY